MLTTYLNFNIQPKKETSNEMISEMAAGLKMAHMRIKDFSLLQIYNSKRVTEMFYRMLTWTQLSKDSPMDNNVQKKHHTNTALVVGERG